MKTTSSGFKNTGTRSYSIIFFLIMFLFGTDSFLISPLLPTLAKSFQVSTESSGWMMSAYSLGFALFCLIVGPFSERMDRKRVIFFGVLGFAIATLGCGIAWNFYSMIAFRFLAGVAASFATPQIWASVPRVTKNSEESVRMMGIVMAGLAGSQVLGVPLGSFLAMSSWHIPFFVVGGFSILMTVLLAMFLPAILPETEGETQSFWGIYRGLLTNHQTLCYVLGFGITTFGLFTVYSFLGTWYQDNFHLEIGMIGLTMLFAGLGQFIGGIFGTKITDKIGYQSWTRFAFICYMGLFLILPFSINIIMAVVIISLFLLVHGMTVPIFMSEIQNSAPQARGTASSLSNFAMYTAQTASAIVAGSLFTNFSGYFGVAYSAVISFAIGLFLFYIGGFWRETKI
ncbi:MFS transporter [Lactococcus lactis]|uniref:MFS transporter n=1 Tax=Lactococcus lactis TaxID=1358 RepID=UPI00205E9421|nr:MFS transporter [Lactococcus lactis]BDH85019.1 MFS transporter [Lactococcus lactis]